MAGKKIFLFLITIFCIKVFPVELIFDTDIEYELIQRLYYDGILNLDIKTTPIRSDKLLYQLKMLRRKNFINGEDSLIMDKLIRRYEKKRQKVYFHFDIQKMMDKKFFSDRKTFYDSIISYTNLSIKNFDGNILYNISFDILYPFVERDSTFYRMKDWEKIGSDFNNTFIGYSKNNYHILFGRMKPSWGGGFYDNIYFSKDMLPLDGILYEHNFGFIKFYYFSAYMTPYYLKDKERTDNTFMSTHRLKIDLPYNLSLSFKEMMLYMSNLPQLQYLNPFILYYIVQNNSYSDDNIIWSFDASINGLKGFSFYSELFIDDFQYQPEFKYVPDKYGFLISTTYVPEKFKKIFFGFEYCMINTYTGTHEFKRLSYTYYDRPMSYFFGTDGDFSYFLIKYMFNKTKSIGYSVSLLRKGSRGLYDSWESEMPQSKPPFPSGRVEINLKNELNFYIEFMKNIFFVDVKIDHRKIKNYENILNNDVNILGLNFKIGVNI